MRTLLILTLTAATLAAQTFTPSGPIGPDGNRATVDLPKSQHVRNVGGSDGRGLCVFTAIQHAGYWQNIKELDGFRKFMEGQPGGGYPDKVDAMIKKFIAKTGLESPKYIQHEGGETEFLDAVLKTDRIVCVTYAGVDDFYRGEVIAHMVNLVHLDDKWAAIIDNNRPGVWVWMSRNAFLNRWRGLSDSGRPMRIGPYEVGGGWAIAFLKSPPPPYTKTPSAFSVEQNCANGKCFAPPTLIATPTSTFTGWEEKDDRFVRFENGIFRGIVKKDDASWHLADPAGSDGWITESSALPDDLENPLKPTGVVFKRVGAKVKYSLNGDECTRHRAFGALVTAGMPDDSNRWHLSVVGDADFAKATAVAIAGLDEEVRSKLHIQFYAPDRWEVNQFLLPNGISLREPSPGRVAKEVGVGEIKSLLVKAGLIKGDPVPVVPDEPKIDPVPVAPVSSYLKYLWPALAILLTAYIIFWRK